jgi:hypothetical protein
MQKFRYDTTQTWFKGNTHIHSTASDGALDFSQLADLYTSAGFQFLFRTDHWVTANVAADLQTYPLLWLDGIELDGHDHTGAYFHIVCLGTFQGIERGMDLEEAVRSARAQGGLIILAHPHWTGNTLQDALRLPLDGIEIYNHICQWMNGKGSAGPLWDSLILAKPGTIGIASDDTHLTPTDPGWNGGWIMVNAPACTSRDITTAIRAGNYYATTGPSFHSIQYKDGKVRVETSPVKFIRLVGPAYHCAKILDPDGCGLTSAEFEIPLSWNPVYIQIEDDQRHLAWTNPLLVESK